MKKDKISRTELAALCGGSVRHVVRVCLLDLLIRGNLKISAVANGSCKIKLHSFPGLQYERILSTTFKVAQPTREPIKHTVADEFIHALVTRLVKTGMLEKKGLYQKSLGLSEKGKTSLRQNRKRLTESKKTLAPGVSGDLVRAFAAEPKLSRLFLKPFQFVCDVRVAGHASGRDWFETIWGARPF
jgi:hypothetical protein